jgi:NAD(P)-dependent dehydrogenase (short-subunit alcohol dehydrogenase family)
VIVTGAGRGLGRSYAIGAASAGAKVVVNDIDLAEAEAVVRQIQDTGGAAVAAAASVGDPGQAAEIVSACVDSFGGVDGLVNNAGIYHEGLAWESDLDQLRSMVEVNVLGSMFCGVLVARELVRQGHGSIVNITSGSMLGISRTSAYAATKGAIASLTYGWALDFADTDVRVNCVSPRAFTNMTISTDLTRTSATPEDHPDRVAPLVVYLLSDLSAHVRGKFVRFNGTELHLVAPPRFAEPVLARDEWDVDTIAAVFENELSERGET